MNGDLLEWLLAGDVSIQGWMTFDPCDRPVTPCDWLVTLRYPDPTPAGHPVRIDDLSRGNVQRYHFVSEGSDEVYFEIGRYPDETIESALAAFVEGVVSRIDGIEIGERERSEVAGHPATRLEIRWPGKRRWIHFLDVDGVTYRVILNPDSALNFAILDELHIDRNKNLSEN
ncbi:MAG TPA: hypothetical protein VMN57_06450 [Anaerolineales bacterium]|nr:hypothetical protein [Anaerolineales bacterium]